MPRYSYGAMGALMVRKQSEQDP